ncbi:unnamed protein product [Vitrella brassicaformis CCMP3155]|uniref:RING-type domain-containing protein n=3 Tax=Vitrella brassicaformis TaxID=1169539 RepID=A0A0G4F128_VITBC|nr:unnamed protein product [Vitrella brassicaformis CCMP3155]|eukprot:CEM05397.1 unnamed protein product [Vitrella brassicaformis CCMP3155]
MSLLVTSFESQLAVALDAPLDGQDDDKPAPDKDIPALTGPMTDSCVMSHLEQFIRALKDSERARRNQHASRVVHRVEKDLNRFVTSIQSSFAALRNEAEKLRHKLHEKDSELQSLRRRYAGLKKYARQQEELVKKYQSASSEDVTKDVAAAPVPPPENPQASTISSSTVEAAAEPVSPRNSHASVASLPQEPQQQQLVNESTRVEVPPEQRRDVLLRAVRRQLEVSWQQNAELRRTVEALKKEREFSAEEARNLRWEAWKMRTALARSYRPMTCSWETKDRMRDRFAFKTRYMRSAAGQRTPDIRLLRPPTHHTPRAALTDDETDSATEDEGLRIALAHSRQKASMCQRLSGSLVAFCQQLLSLTGCPLCQEDLQKPMVVIPCGHVLCHKCCKEVLQVGREHGHMEAKDVPSRTSSIVHEPREVVRGAVSLSSAPPRQECIECSACPVCLMRCPEMVQPSSSMLVEVKLLTLLLSRLSSLPATMPPLEAMVHLQGDTLRLKRSIASQTAPPSRQGRSRHQVKQAREVRKRVRRIYQMLRGGPRKTHLRRSWAMPYPPHMGMGMGMGGFGLPYPYPQPWTCPPFSVHPPSSLPEPRTLSAAPPAAAYGPPPGMSVSLPVPPSANKRPVTAPAAKDTSPTAHLPPLVPPPLPPSPSVNAFGMPVPSSEGQPSPMMMSASSAWHPFPPQPDPLANGLPPLPVGMAGMPPSMPPNIPMGLFHRMPMDEEVDDGRDDGIPNAWLMSLRRAGDMAYSPSAFEQRRLPKVMHSTMTVTKR